MNASEIRAEARKNLTGKWGKSALLTLVCAVIIYIISFLLALVPVVGPIVSAIVSVPLSFGLLVSMIKLNDDQEVSFLEFFNNGMSNFGKVWSVVLNTVLKLIVPIILIITSALILTFGNFYENEIIAGAGTILYLASLIYYAIKYLSYSLILLITYDNPNMPSKEIVEKSAELMKGNIWSYIYLNLTFLGWMILSIFTLGIGMLWLFPYMKLSHIAFYRNLIGEVVTPNNTNDNYEE